MELTFLIWIVSVIISLTIGLKKGNPIGATFLGIVLGPLGVIVAILSGDKNRIPCPYCAEKILKTATICPHCHKELSKPAKT